MSTLPHFTALGGGAPVLMLHGVGGGHLAFAPQVETFASAGYRAVAWDMPGYGHSAPIEPYTFKGLAESCIRLIEALLGASQRRGGIALLGQGMGGMVAQEVVMRRPELVSRLVLCGTAAAGEALPHAPAGEPLLAGQSMGDLAQRLVPQLVGPGALPEGVALAAHCMAGVHPATYRKALEALPTFDRRAQLAQIRMPTLLVAGEFDRSVPPAVMQEMADAIEGSQYVEMKGIGHLQNLEAPEVFDGLVLDFLARSRPTLH